VRLPKSGAGTQPVENLAAQHGHIACAHGDHHITGLGQGRNLAPDATEGYGQEKRLAEMLVASRDATGQAAERRFACAWQFLRDPP